MSTRSRSWNLWWFPLRNGQLDRPKEARELKKFLARMYRLKNQQEAGGK